MQRRTQLSPREPTREVLYDLIHSREQVTRSDLVEATGMSRSAINHAVARLLSEGRVTEAEAESKGPGSGSGRPGALLRAVPGEGHVAGIDFGHDHVQVAVADALGSPLAERRTQLSVDLHANEAMDLAAATLASLCDDLGVPDLKSLTAGIPGPIDSRSGLVRSPTILSGWVGLDPATELRQRIGVPVHTENDAFLGAFGERVRGVGREHTDFLYVKVSGGIGASPVINGEPYRGATGLAGEIGHTPLAGRTELCGCGNRGCLEAVVSIQTVREQIAHTHPGQHLDDVALESLDDPTTHRILNEAGRTVGSVLADLVNLLNPGALVLGGELGCAGRAFVEGVSAAVTRRAQPASADVVDIRPASLGVRSELVGALQHAVRAALLR